MKHCSQCEKPFTPQRMGQVVCSPRCAIKSVRQQRVQERAEHRARKKAAKPKAKWLDEVQALVNRYARVRDAKDGCISCDRPASWGGQWHGSHFRSVGSSSAVRFNLWNVHKACSICNNHLSGNIGNYLPRLIQKIGIEKVEWLKSQNQIVRYDIEYLERFKKVIGKRLKRMEERYAMQG